MTFLTRRFFSREGGNSTTSHRTPLTSITGELLSDPDSELAKFLFVPPSQQRQQQTQSSLNNEEEYNENETAIPSIKSNRAWAYCLALESPTVRSDRIVMVYETYAIFGALFLGGTWVLYEWGSTLAYGGGQGHEVDAINRIMYMIFEPTMAIAIGLNILLAFLGSMMWIMSISFSASNPNWAYSCRHMTVYMQMLFTCMLVYFVTLGLVLGVIAKFAPSIPTVIITLVLIGVAEIPGQYYMGKLVREEVPLELYHSSLWWKLLLSPQSVLTKKGRLDLQKDASSRAATLREQFFSGNRVTHNSTTASSTSQRVDLQNLLKKAAKSIGRSDIDISIYIARLEADLYTDIGHLTGEDVDELSRFMPRRLAKEVHKIIMMAGTIGKKKQRKKQRGNIYSH
eukprot:CAMPEP_0181083810 /NCGR_PEP_ID=MMETSP1071-20121207/4364_1 /TAXON_ID=35127 /ORGANISM="Thalassiosira sp., Strain NH16" /LENGTH=397 /DNA_ID=CAMNT_0023165509 /DNA_START=41 /DNA_END=1234 /DNA_ORIENTATION=+